MKTGEQLDTGVVISVGAQGSRDKRTRVDEDHASATEALSQ